jgi:very-short-patch-repair endonuclease
MKRSPTPAERALWERLRKRQLNGFIFRRQVLIFGFIVDFYCARCRLVVEVDGKSHEGREEYDAMRTKKFGTLRLRVIRFPNEKVLGRMDEVLAMIEKTCWDRRKPLV